MHVVAVEVVEGVETRVVVAVFGERLTAVVARVVGMVVQLAAVQVVVGGSAAEAMVVERMVEG
jgi:hypothetical protein